MKKLFKAIQKNDIGTVKSLLDQSPALISCTLKGTPKKYDGQSPLQVALKEASTAMVECLLTYHPDVNFMEDESCLNVWRAPVIHDAINRAVMYSRWNVVHADGIEIFNDEKEAEEAFALLKKIIEMGADVNARDSFGNACMDRACLQARMILPLKGMDNRILTPELRFDISRIFDLLKENGADMTYIAPNAFGKTYKERYEHEIVGEFLSKDFYLDTDALVLSVIYANNQIDLVKWIGIIDLHERILLGFNEWKSALEKLQKSGLIRFSETQFILSDEAIRLFPKNFIVRDYEKIYNKLSKKKYIEITEAEYMFSESEYLAALQQYKKKFRDFYRKSGVCPEKAKKENGN